MMTVAAIVGGLLPVLLGTGTGSEIMSRIAAPMVGSMLTAPVLSLFVLPVALRLLRSRDTIALKSIDENDPANDPVH